MEKHFDLSDSEFEMHFIDHRIDPFDFTHEAHLRFAWINIEKYGVEQAERNIAFQLKRYVTLVGAEDKFNITLTLAGIKAVNHFKEKSKSDNFKDFIIEFPALKHNFRGLIAAHYGFDIYNSEKAKKEFLKPDLLPFD